MIVFWSLLAIAFIGLLITTLQALQCWRFTRGRRRPFVPGLQKQAAETTRHTSDFQPAGFTPARPRVSILKPLCGLDDDLLENLTSFTRIEGVSHEIIFSIADRSDPAFDIAQRLCAVFPDAPFTIVVGGPHSGSIRNPKIERLAAAMEHARGEIILISDSNVRIEPFDVASTLEVFDDPQTGCSSNLFTGAGAKNFGAALETLHLLTFVAAGSVFAASMNVPCVVGKSMAIRRTVLDELGGFEAFGDVLAEDQAIGLAVKAAGYNVALSPVVVRNVIERRTVRRALARQIRWNKIRYAFSPAAYTGEFLVNPIPAALGAALLATVVGPAPLSSAVTFVALSVAMRIMQGALISHALSARMSFGQLGLIPLQDLLQWLAQFVPYASSEVDWRGHRARLGPGTVMLPVGDAGLRAA